MPEDVNLLGDSNQAPQQADEPQAGAGDVQKSLGWRAALPKHLQDHPLIKDVAKPGDFAEEAVKWHEKLSKSVPLPSDDASSKEFYEKIGRPGKPEEYGLGNDDEAKWFSDFAYKNGLTKTQATAEWSARLERAKENTDKNLREQSIQAKNSSDILRKEYGQNYDSNLKLAGQVLGAAGPNVVESAAKAGLTNNHEFVAWLVSIGQRAGEHKFIGGNFGRTPVPTKGLNFKS